MITQFGGVPERAYKVKELYDINGKGWVTRHAFREERRVGRCWGLTLYTVMCDEVVDVLIAPTKQEIRTALRYSELTWVGI